MGIVKYKDANGITKVTEESFATNVDFYQKYSDCILIRFVTCGSCKYYQDGLTCTLWSTEGQGYLWSPAQGRKNYCRDQKYWEDRAAQLLEIFNDV